MATEIQKGPTNERDQNERVETKRVETKRVETKTKGSNEDKLSKGVQCKRQSGS